MRYSLPSEAIASIAGFGAVAIASSILLMPRGLEMALLQFRSGDRQGGMAMLEERVFNGDHSPATIAALAETRAQNGDLDRAAELLEDLIAQNGPSLPALTMLERYDRAASRKASLTRALAQLQLIAPTLQRQRELVSLYAAAGQEAERLRALRDLVRLYRAEPAEFVSLALAELDAGNLRESEAALQALAARRPDAVEASVVALEIRVELMEGEGDRALARARSWLVGRTDLPLAAPMLAGALSVGHRPDLAVTLLQDLPADPAIVLALAQAESDAGHPAAGLERMERLDTDGAPGMLRLRLALAVGDVDRAVRALDRIGPTAAPHDALLSMAEQALDCGRVDVLRRLVDLSGRDFLAADPLVAALASFALGDQAGALRWAGLVEIAGHPERGVRLAELELQLGRADQAASLLGAALANPALAPAWLRPAASLYVRAHRAETGRLAFDALRQARPGLEADTGWALAATAAGHGQEVTAWLMAPTHAPLPADALQDLFWIAADAHAPELALAAARQLVAARAGVPEQRLLVRALLSANHPLEALTQMRRLPAAAAPEDLRAAVLLAAWRQKAPVAAELRTIWLGRLARAGTVADRDAALSFLVELHAYADLLPTLASLAVRDPEHWLWAFGTAAKATGQRAAFLSVQAQISVRPGVPAVLRRQLAFGLLEGGQKLAAERVFLLLAAAAPPSSPDVQEILFIWGPRPAAPQLDWLEARARLAPPAEKAAWLDILATHGAAARAVAVYRAHAGEPSAALTHAYMAALATTGNRAALAAAVREELARDGSVANLQPLAQLAQQAGDPKLERQLLEKLIAGGAAAPAAQRRLGVLAYQARDMATAERQFVLFTKLTGGDYETRMLLGDLATRRRDPAGARQHYAASLTEVGDSGDQSARSGAVRANLLHRLGRDEEAGQAYELLLAAHPRDKNLRADYAAMLMETGALKRAQAVLAREE